MNLLDRQLIRSYLKAYAICFVSLLSLYIVIDLFSNIEDFTQNHDGLLDVTQHIATYYAYKSAYIFDKMSEAIVLLAAMFTVAWIQKNNELLPQLSAGISTQRVVRPVLFAACLMLGLNVLNQEILIPIPSVASALLNDRNDVFGDNDVSQPWAYEPNGIHIAGRTGSRKQKLVKEFCVTIPEHMANRLVHLIAREARYFPPQIVDGKPQRYAGGWLMTDTLPAQVDDWDNPSVLEMIDPGKFFLYTEEVDAALITRSPKWFNYTSTGQLYAEMSKPESLRLSPMAVLFHMRLTRPILGIILVFLGLSVILRDQNRNIFIAAGLCLIMGAMLFGAMFGCKFLGDHDYLAPALAAWMPVLVFGPIGLVLFDAVHT